MPSAPNTIRRQTLRLLIVAGGVALLLGVLNVAIMRWVLGGDIRSWRAHAVDLGARGTLDLVGQHVRTARDLGEALASRQVLQSLLADIWRDGTVQPEERAVLAARLAELIALQPDLVAIAVIDERGSVVASAGPGGGALAGRAVGRVTMTELAGAKALVTAVPVTFSGANGAALVVGYRLDALLDQLAKEGSRDHLIRRLHAGPPPAIGGGGASVAVPDADLSVSVAIDEASFAQTRRVQAQEIAWAMIGFAAFGALGLALLLRPMTRRIDAQSTALERNRVEQERLAGELRRSNAGLEELARELRRSNEDLQQFALFASHDLQEPLRMVWAYLGLLERSLGAELPTKARDHLRRAVDGARRMQEMIHDLLVYARLGRGDDQRREAALDAALAAALRVLAPRIAAGGARIEAAPLLAAFADERQIAHVFQNLIANAIKYRGEASPVIRVASEARDDGWIEVRVADNGRGIRAEDRDRVFALFDRGSARGDQQGTGVGLALCQRIVERHGGRIWCEGDPGGGTVFRFTLPATAATAPAAPAPAAATAPAESSADPSPRG